MSIPPDPVRLVIIAIPPQPLRQRLEDLRDRLAELSGSRAAMAWPVHLTLRTGALVPPERLRDFFHEFGQWVATIPAFPIVLGNFVVTSLADSGQQGGGANFAGFEVKPKPELMDAHRRLVQFEAYKKSEQYTYNPHVTMAFDDLSDEGAQNIRSVAKEMGYLPVGQSWTCDRVDCYAWQGGTWQSAASLPLRGV